MKISAALESRFLAARIELPAAALDNGVAHTTLSIRPDSETRARRGEQS